MKKDTTPIPFTSYQKFTIFILAFTQFSVILDFMIMAPLGDMLMKSLSLKPSQFGIAMSAYAFSAGISGLLTAGFADRFDRKKLLLFFFTGFIVGTVCCGLATTYGLLIAARIITGLFGGVIGSISMAIVTDTFDIHHRGRVMGFLQMGYGASQVLGVPVSLFVANKFGWQSPFMLVAAISGSVAVMITMKLKPVVAHLPLVRDKSAIMHLLHTVAKRNYRIGFLSTAFISIGGFMMMPFSSAFAINNLKVTQQQLPFLFMVSGLSSLTIMPIIGRLSDRVDKFKIFAIASVWMMLVVLFYSNLSVTPIWIIMIFNICMMIGIMSRTIPASALTSGVPDHADRGAFMSINSSLQQIAGGVAAAFAGLIVVQKDKTSPLVHYNTLGYIVITFTLIGILMIYRVSLIVKKKLAEAKV